MQECREPLRYGNTIKYSLWEEPVDGGKNPLQQKGSLPISQVPIRLTNTWYGRPDEIMESLPSRG